MRRLITFLGIALVAATLSPSAAIASSSADCLNEYPIEMYRIEVNELKPRYQIGTKVGFQISVTMPAENNPANYLAGSPLPWVYPAPAAQPAPDVPVTVWMSVGPEGREVFLYNSGVTDGQGLVEIKVKLKEYVQPGMAQVVVFAKKEIYRDAANCFVLVYFGRKLMPDAFEAVE